MNTVTTKIKSLDILTENAVYGAIYHKVFLPLINGTIEIPNRHNIVAIFNDVKYVIRTDNIIGYFGAPQHISNDEFMIQYRDKVVDFINDLATKQGLLHSKGVGIFKDLTDINDLQVALTTSNTFKRQGVGVTSRKIQIKGEGVGEDLDGTMEYKVTSDFGKHSFTTTDVDEMMIFLGSLARVYTQARQIGMSMSRR